MRKHVVVRALVEGSRHVIRAFTEIRLADTRAWFSITQQDIRYFEGVNALELMLRLTAISVVVKINIAICKLLIDWLLILAILHFQVNFEFLLLSLQINPQLIELKKLP